MSSLPEEVQHSKYGCVVVSDVDLCVNLKHIQDFEKKMKELNISNLTPEYDRLRKNRANVKKFISRLMDVVYESFELPDMPNTAEKKARLDKEDVTKRGEEKLQKLAEEARPKKSGKGKQPVAKAKPVQPHKDTPEAESMDIEDEGSRKKMKGQVRKVVQFLTKKHPQMSLRLRLRLRRSNFLSTTI